MLVALTHAELFLSAAGARSPFWDAVDPIFRTLRMPLFFILAGLFAGKWIARPWTELLRSKILLLAWLYALWAVIRFCYFIFVPQVVVPDESSSIIRLLAQAVRSTSDTWFLYALAVFFVLAKIFARTPVGAQLFTSGALSVLALTSIFDGTSTLWAGMAKYFFFFLAGALLSRSIIEISKRKFALPLAVAAIPVWAGAAWIAANYGVLNVIGVRFTLSIFGIVAGIGIAMVLSRSRLLAYLGRNTMPIYLNHSLWIGAIAAILQPFGASALTPWALLLVPVTTAAAVAFALLVRRVLLRLRMPWFYEPPHLLVRVLPGGRGGKDGKGLQDRLGRTAADTSSA